jgi:acetyltransferase-like isoleucine patch superfamily enzyme
MQNPFDPGYYDTAALRAMGFAAVGEHVRVAKNCTIIGLANIRLGDHVRIDGYSTLIATGGITIGSYVHIAGYCLLSGGDGIAMDDFSGLSHGVKLYSRTDDYGGDFLTNPTVPAEYLGVIGGKVTLGRHAIIGSNTVVLPGSTVAEGSSVGAQSLVKGALEPWGVYAGVPARRLKARSRKLLELEAQLRP